MHFPVNRLRVCSRHYYPERWRGTSDGNGNDIQKTTAMIQGVGSITQDILAEIPQAGDTSATAAATAAVGRFGAVGLTASDFSGVGSITFASVEISNDEFLNPLSLTQEIFSNVLIDGGILRISQGQRVPNSEIRYIYKLSSTFQGGVAGPAFCSSGALVTDSTGTVVTFLPNIASDCMTVRNGQFVQDNFVDLHASFDPLTWTVTIPKSFQSFDLGALPPNQTMALDYSFYFELDHSPQRGQPSDLFAQFSDPLHLSANSALGTITMEPVTASTPEPGTLLLLGLALFICLFARGRYRRATPGISS